jgi:methylated-DNA-[protein]-cysteine S-methyltransferase
MNDFCFVNSPIGVLELEAEFNSISRIKFRDSDSLQLCIESKKVGESHALTQASKQINEYFNGTRKLFEIPFKLNVTPFYKKVLLEVKRVKYGDVVSYGQIAQMAGNNKAARAVGTANAKNPLPIIIPCHRVISSNGNLGGYSGGLDKKLFLLDHENSLFH